MWLDREVAVWLHKLANEHYRGNVQTAMNEALKAIMKMEQNPEDRWKAISWQAASRRRGSER